jgi:predicted aspartyl protease
MPSVSVGLPNLRLSGPVLDIQIGPSKPVLDLLGAKGQPVPSIRCTALVDTGASSTVIKTGIASQLNLHPRGVVNIATPSCSAYQCNTYDVSLLFPVPGVMVGLLTVTEAPLSGQNIDCLIGRDLLHNCILIYEGYSNRFVLSF